MRSAYKCRAYPTPEQVAAFNRIFGCVRLVWNKTLAKAISDASWAELRSLLECKAARAGRHLIVIDRWYPSSKTCSTCGYLLPKLGLGTRHWTCPACRTRHDRDINAAKNILAAGRAVAGEPSGDACGADVRQQGKTLLQSAMKQETPAARRPA
ncbi:zinc ribbon domain-containing protein [Actinoplanes sp. NPDC051851]|uniref:zinc ribbon domain-containing protein n=1 Tax=Actinoplanes sp. NPDC051851 TaxID=3154753 RepID=UPI00341D21EA